MISVRHHSIRSREEKHEEILAAGFNLNVFSARTRNEPATRKRSTTTGFIG
jgi:hypothetical protein